MLWGSWVALLVSSVAGVALQGVYASQLPLSDVVRPSLFNEVLHTRFGEVEALRVVLLAAFVPVLFVLRGIGDGHRGRWWAGPGALVGLGLLATPGLAGHATSGGGAALGLTLEVAHLAAVSVWFGGLALLAALLFPGLRTNDWSDDLISVARRFSAYAFGAVVVVVATGVVQSVREVGSLFALFNTVYGRILMVKIGLVVVLVAMGMVSRRIVLGRTALPGVRLLARSTSPADSSRPGAILVEGDAADGADGAMSTRTGAVSTRRRADSCAVTAITERGAEPGRSPVPRLRRSVLAEAAVALGVLLTTSLLVNAAPAKQAAAQPFTQSFEVLGDQLNAVIGPARVGPDNQFHFYVLGRLGQPTGIPELDAAISLPSQGIGPIAVPLVVGGPGHYLATRVEIPIAGDWHLKLTVRTSAIDEQELFATVSVR
jgi:copper transport protein